MIRAAKSFLVVLKASSLFGRAVKLSDAGRKDEALAVGQEVLAVLRRPEVNRASAMAASTLACCTVLVEDLASQLHQPGAEQTDIGDALNVLRGMPSNSKLVAWIDLLESRSGLRGTSAV